MATGTLKFKKVQTETRTKTAATKVKGVRPIVDDGGINLFHFCNHVNIL